MSIDRRAFLASLPAAAAAPAVRSTAPADPRDLPLREFLAPVRHSLQGDGLDWRTTRLLTLAKVGGGDMEMRRNERPCNACGHADYEYRWVRPSGDVYAWGDEYPTRWFCVCGCAVDTLQGDYRGRVVVKNAPITNSNP